MNIWMKAAAGLLACAVGLVFIASEIAAAGEIWDGGGANNNINTPQNWNEDTLPALTGSTANLVFAGATRLTPSINIPISPLSIRFDAMAAEFALGGSGPITIGSSSISENGHITNESTSTQTITPAITWNRGTINALSGDLVINGAINVGGGSNIGGRSLNIDGDHDVFFNNTIQGTGTSTSGGGVISKIGSGIWHITADSPAWAGRIGIDAGILRASAPDALGSPNSRTLVQGGSFLGTSRLELAGGVTFAAERLELTGRLTGFMPVHLSNFSGNNTWTGPIILNAGGGEYGLDSSTGKLTVTGSITNATGNTEVRTIRFAGAGDGEFAGVFIQGNGPTGSPSTGPFAVRKEGAGTWTLSNPALTYAGDTLVTGGTLAVAPGIVISASPVISITGGGTLDLADGNVGRLPGQTLIVDGTLNATVNDVGGATVPGGANTAGTMNIGNHLNFTGGGTISFDLGAATTVGGGVNDLVAVNGNLTLGGATTLAVNNLNGSIASGTYRLFNYGGTITGGVANLQLAAPPTTRQTMALTTATHGQVNLDISGSAANLIWRGDSFLNFWDVNGSFNWEGTPEGTYFNLDHVSFLDPPGTPNTLVTITGPVFPASVTVSSSRDYTFAGGGRISGGAGITKGGPGNLIIDTNNNNFGTTIIVEGTVQVGAGGNTGSLGTGNVINSGLLRFNRSTNLTVSGIITGPGNLEQAGSSTLILLGENTYLGTTTISAGTLQIGNGTDQGSIGPGSVINNGALVINRRDDIVFTNLISGTGRVEKAGTENGGPIEFTALNTYTGSTTINGSRTVLIVDHLANGGAPSNIGASTSDAANLHIRTDATLRYVGPGVTTDRLFTIGNAKIDASGTGPLVFSNTGAIGTSGGNRTLTLLGANTQGNTLAAAIVDDASATSLVKNGEGTWIISGNSTYSGVTTVSAGTLRVAAPNALGTAFNGTAVAGEVAGKGRLEIAGGITVTGETLTMGGRQGSSAPVPHLTNVSGDNQWAGPIRLILGGVDYTLQSNAGTLSIGGDITQTLTNAEHFLNLQGAAGGVVNGRIVNGGGTQVMSLRKRGAGTWTLNGHNTYVGSTTVEQGTLVANTGIGGPGSTTVGLPTSPADLHATYVRQASLTISRDSEVKLLSGGIPSVVGSLAITGDLTPLGKLDLNDGAMILDYTPAGMTPEPTIRAQIVSGRGGSGLGKTWNGPGITSSQAAIDPVNSMSVAYAVNGDLPLGPYEFFFGQSVDASSVLMRYTRTADANLDGVVNNDDVTIVGANYAPGFARPYWARGDFDYSGFVDNDDVTLLGINYNLTAPSIPAPVGETTAVAAVPEPANVVLAVAGVAILIVFSTRRPKAIAA